MQKNQNIRYRDMKQFDENRFKEALSQAPWDTVFVFDEIDDMLDSWESLFNSILDENCPWREKRVKRGAQAPWMTSSVLKQLHLRDNCLKPQGVPIMLMIGLITERQETKQLR